MKSRIFLNLFVAALVIIALTEPKRLFAPLDRPGDLVTCVPEDLA